MSKKKDKNRKNRSLIKVIGIAVFCMLFSMTVVMSILFIMGKDLKDYYGQNVAKEELGIELVHAMYDFDSPYQLDSQMLIVQAITTESVFNDITIDNEQRTLLTYLKFKDCGVHVNIIDSSDEYVRYTLNSEAVEPEREFILFFVTDSDGLICEIEEAEYVKFIDTIY